jgi:murein DD-endopeptidase MepM/ murein hydrolase activator NlpD
MARPNHAHVAVPQFLPPQPLAERDRARKLAARLGRRFVALVASAVLLALLVPVALSALGPSGTSLQPLGGEVAGAVSGPKTATPSPTVVPVEAAIDPGLAIDPRLVQAGATDADGPLPFAQRRAPPVASLTGYVWPIRVGRVSLPFKAIPGGEWINDGKLFHDGVDMASFCGAPVGAAHDGVVLAAGRHFDEQIGWIGDLRPYFHVLDVRHMWGDLPNVVVIDDGNGYRSIYAHFRDVTVRVGQRVKAGEKIGYEGATGHASGCHVHYGLFSPRETATFGVRADILRGLKVPQFEIARIDPLAVLPGGDVALRTRQIAKAIAAAHQAMEAAQAHPTSTGTAGR